MRSAGLTLSALLLAGCGNYEMGKDEYLRSLTMDGDGGAVPVRVIDSDAQVPEYPNPDFRDHVHRIVTNPDFIRAKRVLIYVHGGMVSLGTAIDKSERILAALRQDPAMADAYPIMIHWNSEFVSSYFDHLAWVRSGRRSPWTGPLTSPVFLFTDAGKAVARSPVVLGRQAGNLPQWLFFKSHHPPASWQEQASISDYCSHPFWTQTMGWVCRLTVGMFRLVTSVLMDVAGTAAYEMMERRIQMLFANDSDFGCAVARSPSGALTVLLDAIRKAGNKPVSLFGHSMGTIVINELLRRNPDLKADRIVFLAAACSIKDFIDTIPPYLRKERGCKFYSVSLHPKADNRERNFYYLVPEGSLLEWLDYFVQNPKTPLYRTLGKWNNIVPMLELLEPELGPVRPQVHLKAFPVDRELFPRLHGEMDDFKFWKPEYPDPKSTAVPERIP